MAELFCSTDVWKPLPFPMPFLPLGAYSSLERIIPLLQKGGGRLRLLNDEDKKSAEFQAMQNADDAFSTQQMARRRLLAGVAAGTTVVGTIALIGPFVSPLLKKSPFLPYMATPPRKIQRALQHLNKLNKGGGVFVDLGSGDGEGVHQSLRAGYRQAIGVENNFTLWAFSELRRRLFWSRDFADRSEFHLRDMFSYDISHADTVMVFGVRPLMHPISQKLARECRDGTHILSYRFALPMVSSSGKAAGECTSSQPHQRAENLLLQADLVYDEDEMRIFECRRDR